MSSEIEGYFLGEHFPLPLEKPFEVTRHFLLPFFHGMACGLPPCLLSHYVFTQESLLKDR
jgi:hypothetical protein